MLGPKQSHRLLLYLQVEYYYKRLWKKVKKKKTGLEKTGEMKNETDHLLRRF